MLKYLLLLGVVLSLQSACKSSGEMVSTYEEEHVNMQNPWTRIDFKPSKEMILPNGYTTYVLDTALFNKQLQMGKAHIPMEDGEMTIYDVKNSNTMSAELQAKFPNIKSYVGNSTINTLCQARIDQKNMEFKISILCNNGTTYLQELYDLGIYFIYNKKDLPAGVGTVKE